MRTRSAETLLREVVDYAGMFPPAHLEPGDAMSAYTRYRAGEDAWVVGTFVVSAERLGELDPAVGPLSVVMPTGSAADVEQVLRARERLHIAAFEFRPLGSDDIQTIAALMPGDIQAYFEVPPGEDLNRRLDAVAKSGRFAKIRTGGLTPDAFPRAPDVYRFFQACAQRDIATKATAGLHHALAGCYPLTYEPASANAPMYGFLNVCAAAALVHTGGTQDDVLSALAESSPAAFEFDDDGMEWRGRRISTRDLIALRQVLFRSFGSCSLQQPIDELKRMQVI